MPARRAGTRDMALVEQSDDTQVHGRRCLEDGSTN